MHLRFRKRPPTAYYPPLPRLAAGLLLPLLLLLCSRQALGQRPAGWQPPEPPVDSPLAIGHAGSGFLTLLRPFNPLPPSSRRSIRRALARGADGVEVDVRLSQDSVAVLYHDPQLESMTTGAGCVSQTPVRALTRLDYRVRWPYRWFQPQERVRRLDSLLVYLGRRPTFPYLHLDLHEDDPCATNNPARDAALARQLRQLLSRYRVPPGRVTIISSRPAMLRHLGQLLPAVGLGLEVDDAYYPSAITELDRLPGVGAVVLHKDAFTPERLAQLHALGRQVVVFGGRSAGAVGRVVATGPDAYEVDNLRQLQRTLRRQRQQAQ
ncbi:glycerophosphodiester phosphodiesterase [Hymenobacter actinosclerus]|uniref:Glycerophosphoryl diester phosphodiesterase n=1 Tax=Hymenobacter actinosclerus TaxID=82805 RepID=A0A1I0E1X7_9BACT|nr:glycerophosphodiester phosphodiesterase [Hymenobacter actinosclerus]SET38622.1 glycerophosphoryl diester phosphodiesterase [Hymenobacter actinosclerus]